MKGMNWIYLVMDKNSYLALLNSVMNIQVPLNEANSLTSQETVSFSGRTVLQAVIWSVY